MEKDELVIPNELTIEEIKNLIYTIRGKQVMLDSDVAMLYNSETKKVNQSVKRNFDRFPERFCFQLTEEEFSNLRSQIVTLKENRYSQSLRFKIFTLNKNGRGQHRKYIPYVFSEHGITMLAGLLKCQLTGHNL